METQMKSFLNALRGLAIAWREEANFRIQIALGLVALLLGYVLDIEAFEWMMVVLAIGFVLSAEALNTALEEFCDMVKGDPDPHIAKIKDLAAAAVLVASSTALVLGAVVFLPRLF